MLNPDLLRRRTAEATERLTLERQAEEERLRLEEAEREEAEERLRQLEAERVRLQKLAKKAVSEGWGRLVRAAVRGARGETIPTSPEVTDAVLMELKGHRLSCRIKRWSMRRQVTLECFGKFLLKLPDSVEISPERAQLALALESESTSDHELVDLLRTLSESAETLGANAKRYLEATLLPHLLSTVADTTILGVQVSWEPRDLGRTRFTNRWQVPSWLSSTSGSGLLQRIGESLESDAERGLTQTQFEVCPLAMNPPRWGGNAMCKLLHNGHPIGVTPFTGDILVELLTVLGFAASLSTKAGQSCLDVKWE